MQEHAAGRARYDAIRALLRLAAWLGFTARAAAAHAPAGLLAGMALASLLYALLPVALLALNPDAFLRWAGRECKQEPLGSRHVSFSCRRCWSQCWFPDSSGSPH